MLTIGMPIYNEGRHLEMAVRSLIGQTLTDFKLIVSDNGSTDDTPEIMQRLVQEDSRVQYHRHAANRGAAANFRFVLDAADTEYFMFAAGHDLWDPSFAQRCLAALEGNEGACLVYPDAVWFDNENRLVGEVPGRFETKGMAPLSRMMVTMWGLVFAYQFYGMYRTEYLKRLDFSRTTIGRDHILLCELALMADFVRIPEPLMFLRANDDFKSVSAYNEKLFVGEVDTHTALAKYCKLISEYVEVVEKMIPPSLDRQLAIMSAVECCLLRYRNALEMNGASFSDILTIPEFNEYLGVVVPVVEEALKRALNERKAPDVQL